jgi:hypothetical protein
MSRAGTSTSGGKFLRQDNRIYREKVGFLIRVDPVIPSNYTVFGGFSFKSAGDVIDYFLLIIDY